MRPYSTPYVVSPLDGLRAALSDEVRIVHGLSVRSGDRTEIAPKDLLRLPDSGGPGAEVIFFDAEDRELGREQRRAASMMCGGVRCRRSDRRSN